MIENSENEKDSDPRMKMSRRENRARRLNVKQMWERGALDDHLVKERWSREFKNPRLKKIKNPTTHFDEENIMEGLVLEVHRRTCEVRLDEGRIVTAEYKATVVDELGEFPAVGDFVVLGVTSEEKYAVIKVHSRRSALVRPGPRDRLRDQLVLAANIDQVVIVASVEHPAFNYGFVDRFLLAANLNRLPFILVLNKMDLVSEMPKAITDFMKIVDHSIAISCETKEGLEELKKALQGKVSVFSGQSGVGKSTLINHLVPEAALRTGAVRHKDGKGRHTTTSSSLFDLPGGGMVIDTPGIRSLGLLNIDSNDLAKIFPGFFKDELFTCKFSNCLHISEIGCSVREALSSGELSQARYESYLRILNAKE